MLIILGGLPGTGKSTLAKQICQQLPAVYLRIDTIEQSLKRSEKFSDSSVGPEGYMLAWSIAADNLALGLDVLGDSVNPLAVTRENWRQIAKDAGTVFVEIELICSNKQEHQRRVETRKADIIGHQLPVWQDVVNRDYEPWENTALTIDTSVLSMEDAVQMVLEHILKARLVI